MKNRFGLLLFALFTISSNSGVYAQAPLPPLARRAATVDDRFVAPVTPKTDPPQSGRLIVKLRPQFAGEVEAELPGSMSLSLENVRGETLRSFLNRCSARSLAPLYPQVLRLRREQGLSGRAFAEQIRQRFARRARRLEKTFNPPDISRTYVLQLASSDARDRLRVLSLLRKDARVEFAEEDAIASISSSPNDPYFSTHGSWGQPYDDLWGLKKINAPSAWDTASGEGITVAVVDTGLDASHPDIQANEWRNSAEIPGNLIDDDNNGFVDDVGGWNFSYETNNPADDHGHGTHVAGTIAAVGNNGIGVIGVAYKAKIMPVKGLDRTGVGGIRAWQTPWYTPPTMAQTSSTTPGAALANLNLYPRPFPTPTTWAWWSSPQRATILPTLIAARRRIGPSPSPSRRVLQKMISPISPISATRLMSPLRELTSCRFAPPEQRWEVLL